MSPQLAVRTPTGRVRSLIAGRFHVGLPSWSPDRRHVAFISARRGDADVYVMNADGTGVRRLAGAARRGSDELYPAWSPDGRLIAFSSAHDGSGHVYVVRADGSGLRRLTTTPAGIDNQQPRFSADGRSVLFVSNRAGGSPQLYRVPTRGGTATRVVTMRGGTLMPDVSPDGRLIAVVSYRSGRAGIWLVRTDGRAARLVVRRPGREVAYLRFSPDGRRLLYSTFRAGETVDAFEVRSVALDGTRDTRIGPGAEADW